MGLLDKVKETAQKGADFAKEGVKAGQEKIDSHKLEKKIGELKEELGGIVYAQKSGNAPVNAEADITRIVGEITATQAELDASDSDDASDDSTEEGAPSA
jgi:hypothetical protein